MKSSSAIALQLLLSASLYAPSYYPGQHSGELAAFNTPIPKPK